MSDNAGKYHILGYCFIGKYTCQILLDCKMKCHPDHYILQSVFCKLQSYVQVTSNKLQKVAKSCTQTHEGTGGLIELLSQLKNDRL